MRSDMSKVLVERPRPGSGWNKPGLYRRAKKFQSDPEAAPAKESMKRRYTACGGEKMFNENLAPLRRFLGRRVGRPWDKVYSEISANVDRTNPVQNHIFTHLWQFVLRGVFARDGRLVAINGNRVSPIEMINHEFYVDLKGFLRVNKRLTGRAWYAAFRAMYPRPEIDLEFRIVAKANRHFAKVRVADGSEQWFEVELKPVPGAGAWDQLFRRPIGEVSHEELFKAYGKTTVYACAKRPLSSKEIKRLEFA